jgi:tetratricopeptide (TPR) repeat protein
VERIGALRAWLESHPNDRFAAYSLALELEKAGQAEEAIAAMRAVVAQHPQSGAAHLHLGRMLAALGRRDEARAAWEAGLVELRGSSAAEAVRSSREIEAAMDALDDD